MTLTNEEMLCLWCGVQLNDEEMESPRTDCDGEPICDECWHHEYEFTCCLCHEEEHVDLQHYYLIVKVPTPGNRETVIPGIWYITGGPYHGGSMLSGVLFNEKLIRLRDVPKGSDLDEDYYPTGHLCQSCVDKLSLPKTSGYTKACKELKW